MFGKFKQAIVTTVAAATLSAIAGVGTASAVTITDQTMIGGSGIKVWSDNSAETLSGPDGVVDVGDILTGIMQFNTVENLLPAFPIGTRPIGSGGVNEMTAIYQFEVISKTCVGPLCTFDFGPTAAFAATVAGLGFAGPTAGAVAAFFEDTTPDFTRVSTVAVGTASATNGTPYLLLGLTGPGAFFQAISTNGDDISVFPSAPGIGGFFNGGANVIQNYTGMDFKPNACSAVPLVQVCIGGTVAGPGPGSDFDLFDDVNLTINVATVPEPASLSLFGLGLLGLAALRRRKNKA